MIRRSVSIVAPVLLHYRTPFYEGLQRALQLDDVDLHVIVGNRSPNSLSDAGRVNLPWATAVSTRYLRVAGRDVCWQQAVGATRGSDLVILEQATRLLASYPILTRQLTGSQRVAFWGHGRCVSCPAASERFKRILSRRVHWWFAYTELSARTVRHLGYPSERITVVNNAIDSQTLARACAEVGDAQLAELRARHGIRGDNIAVFVGVMHPRKEIPFLIDAAIRIRELVPDFEFVLIGSGTERPVAEAAARRYSWIHAVGPVFGPYVAPYLRLARVMLHPGAVGLVALDALVSGCPLITRTSSPHHGPEIAYLRDGVNGIMVTAPDPESYARAVARVLDDDAELDRLRRGCRAAAPEFTIEHMVERYAGGVLAALSAPVGGGP